MPKKILLLTHVFPPYVFPESYLITKKLGNLKDCEIDVITMEAFFPWVTRDLEFEALATKDFSNIQRLKPPTWYKYLPFSKLEVLFSLPDAYLYLLPLYVRKIKTMSLDNYDIVVTWSMYHSVHLLGPLLKKKYPALRWIAHFSDPWSDNPFFTHGRFVKFINEKLESYVFKGADKIVFTSLSTLENFTKKYSFWKNKAHYIAHCFVEKLYPKKINKNKIYTIRYLGSFYKSRSPKPFIDGLIAINKDDPEFLNPSKIRIEFIGSSEFNIDDLLGDLPPGLLMQRSSISYIESLRLMKESDLLLVIDAPFENSPFLPSKIVDYFGAEKVIFGVGAAGVTRSVLENAGFLVASPDNPEEIAEKFKQSIASCPIKLDSEYDNQRRMFAQTRIQKEFLDLCI